PALDRERRGVVDRRPPEPLGSGADGRVADLRGRERGHDPRQVRGGTAAPRRGRARVIALVTDSNAQLPDDLRDRFAVHVVPLTIVLDDDDRLEGVDLDPDEFYDRLAAGAEVSTAAPSPGRFAEVYERAA